MLCSKCYGSGRIMGQGMVYKKCSCQYEEEKDAPKPVQIDKRSKAYREAISKIMQENKMDKDEAAKLFEEEFYKIA
jgi:hypothetical protein